METWLNHTQQRHTWGKRDVQISLLSQFTTNLHLVWGYLSSKFWLLVSTYLANRCVCQQHNLISYSLVPICLFGFDLNVQMPFNIVVLNMLRGKLKFKEFPKKKKRLSFLNRLTNWNGRSGCQLELHLDTLVASLVRFLPRRLLFEHSFLSYD